MNQVVKNSKKMEWTTDDFFDALPGLLMVIAVILTIYGVVALSLGNTGLFVVILGVVYIIFMTLIQIDVIDTAPKKFIQ